MDRPITWEAILETERTERLRADDLSAEERRELINRSLVILERYGKDGNGATSAVLPHAGEYIAVSRMVREGSLSLLRLQFWNSDVKPVFNIYSPFEAPNCLEDIYWQGFERSREMLIAMRMAMVMDDLASI
jgi:hypothetical protein